MSKRPVKKLKLVVGLDQQQEISPAVNAINVGWLLSRDRSTKEPSVLSKLRVSIQ